MHGDHQEFALVIVVSDFQISFMFFVAHLHRDYEELAFGDCLIIFSNSIVFCDVPYKSLYAYT